MIGGPPYRFTNSPCLKKSPKAQHFLDDSERTTHDVSEKFWIASDVDTVREEPLTNAVQYSTCKNDIQETTMSKKQHDHHSDGQQDRSQNKPYNAPHGLVEDLFTWSSSGTRTITKDNKAYCEGWRNADKQKK